MKIVAYMKPHCGWSRGVRAILEKYDLPFEEKDIVSDREIYAEMVSRSGQQLSPCVEIDGVMLADVSGEEVENYLLANGLVEPNDLNPSAPTNHSCSGQHRHAVGETAVRFF